MDRRIIIAAIAVTLAAFGISQSRLPEARSLVGTYVAQGRQAPTRHVLTLNGDLSATLRTDAPDSSTPANMRGSWILDGPTVQVSLSGGDEATTLWLTLRDGGFVVAGSGRLASLTGLAFARAAEPPAN